MENALKYNYEEGVEEGVELGEHLKLIRQVCKKLVKGKYLFAIAEELEEEFEVIERTCVAAKSCDIYGICIYEVRCLL